MVATACRILVTGLVVIFATGCRTGSNTNANDPAEISSTALPRTHPTGSVDCHDAATTAGLDAQTIALLCNGSDAPSRANCIVAASAPLAIEAGSRAMPREALAPAVIKTLCANCSAATVESDISCITNARMAGLPDVNITNLCSQADPATGECLAASIRTLASPATGGFSPIPALSGQNLLSVCSLRNSNSGPCITACRTTGISLPTITSLCNRATPATAPCINAARPSASVALSEFDTATICGAATDTTASCIHDARSQGLSNREIYLRCDPRT